MKSFHDLIINRRSIRKYTPNEISPENVKTILEAALLCPTSKNKRPWQFIVVENKQALEELSKCKDLGAKPIANCSLAVFVVADGNIDTWIEDSAIAAFTMQLQAEDLGLGSCWIQIRNRFQADTTPAEEFVQNFLEIPADMRVLCAITLGEKDEERKPMDPEKCIWEKMHIGKW